MDKGEKLDRVPYRCLNLHGRANHVPILTMYCQLCGVYSFILTEFQLKFHFLLGHRTADDCRRGQNLVCYVTHKLTFWLLQLDNTIGVIIIHERSLIQSVSYRKSFKTFQPTVCLNGLFPLYSFISVKYFQLYVQIYGKM